MPPKSDQPTIVRKNAAAGFRYLYHRLMRMGWGQFVLLFFILFLLIHAFFACLYLLDSESINGTEGPASWWEAFCFSVQSLSTIGYGVLSPNGFYANALVTVQAFVGLLYGAVLTGCFFAKVSRPAPQILFSRQLTFYPIKGVPHLVMRVANALDGGLIDVKAEVFARLYDEDENVFRLLKLPLRRDQTPNMALNWVLYHPIDHNSPLYDIPVASWHQRDIRIMVNITGHDSVYQQLVHHQASFSASEIVFNHRYVDMITLGNGEMEVDLSKIHDIEPIGD